MFLFNTNMNMQLNLIGKSNTSQNLSFKGYFAAPLKEVLFRAPNLSGKVQDDFIRIYQEVANIGQKEGFGVRVQAGHELLKNLKQKVNESLKPVHPWLQDTCTILDNKKMIIQDAWNIGNENALSRRIAENLGIKAKDIKQGNIPSEIAGGNFFIGKDSDGSKFALAGEDCRERWTYPQLKNLFEVDKVHFLPQLDYHIDLGVRPLKGNRVLVADDNLHLGLTKGILQRLKEDRANKKANVGAVDFYKKYISMFNSAMRKNDKSKNTANCEQVIEALKTQGYEPIRVPGRSYDVKNICGSNNELKYNFNYMNAIVHQNPKGELVYITNSAPKGINIFNKVFENYIKLAAPEIKKVVFVDGNGAVSNILHDCNGGIHCLGTEVPDFSKWKV